MTGAELRKSFTEFFADRGHTIVPSASVVPWDDPTLLFTNAGMNQFKDVFLGKSTREYVRAVDFQKCIRAGGKHNDLEDVGRSPIHQTFFEMLGNWSFGDYYKEEAITWAWELLTERLDLPAERLWVSVFREDDEAELLWQRHTGVPADRILRFDEKDNFWEMGETGPCGPNSEIHYDLGPERTGRNEDPGHVGGANGDQALEDPTRLVEIWNLVFIQYDRGADGALTPLPSRHVDTGMGFERMLSILQGVDSNYDTDVFRPLMDHIGELSQHPYAKGDTDVAYRVVADHIRALAFAIADGALPSNEGRGYVLRRILRRAARYGRNLGLADPFLYRLVPTLTEEMGAAYPELSAAQEKVEQVIRSEEESFGRTLDHGIELFEDIVERAGAEGRNEIRGVEAFKLYDTYGFPVDLTQLMADEKDMTVDMAGFEAEMGQQRERSRSGGKTVYVSAQGTLPNVTGSAEVKVVTNTKFVGYDTHLVERTTIAARENGSVLLTETPFYAESGGQVGDTGWLETESGGRIAVLDTTRDGDTIIHQCDPGSAADLKPGMTVTARVDSDRRQSIMRNHTATHLLHAVLRETLGAHVEQRGSVVAPDRLRFDFAHFSAVTPEEQNAIERRVNELVWENIRVEPFETDLEEAKHQGAMALFTEKYEDRVRVVRIGEVSLELCGGTHLGATGEIGLFRLVRESGIAAGVRRVEALTGAGAYESVKRDEGLVAGAAEALKSEPEDLAKRAGDLTARVRELERHIREMGRSSSQNWVDELADGAVDADGVAVAAGRVDCPDMDTLRAMGDSLRERLSGAAVGVLFASFEERPVCIVVATDGAISGRGLHAGKLARDVAAFIGGGGGGKAHMAQAGGKDASRIDEAVDQAPGVVEKHLRDA
ncbi:MAG: alanine--tRNA ligase [Gemmatimonadetes bacterium]|nr:alanine--tRNA ligase [Gemmatimonadota bacterium]